MDLDVALVPAEARHWPPTICIVVDQLRASSTITALLDAGCADLLLTRSLGEARGLGGPNTLLAGERRGLTPRGFHANNSPVELLRLGVRGHRVVLSTSNGTAVLRRLAAMPVVLVGCLLNAAAVAEAAVDAALSRRIERIGIVCAGVEGRFALDDTVAAGAIAANVVDLAASRGADTRLTDAALAAIRLRAGYDDLEVALRDSVTGDLVTEIGADEDIPFCARLDATRTVGVLQPGPPLRIARVRPRG